MEFSAETINKIKRNKGLLEKRLNTKIEITENNINLEGKPEDIFIGEKVLDAIDKNFPISTSLLLIDENYVLEDIPIKNIRDKNLENTKARIIGTGGKTLKTLSELSSCHITLHNNTVSIIGEADKIKEIMTAIENLIRGSKQANVYKYLEKNKKQDIEDLGLKE
tara:strand:+ start:39 stop:533 length:495 start_codon:yes stop_codon:yes gene_type:complete